MKLIPLTQGQFTKVDDDDFEYLNQWKWYARWANCTKSFYAVRMIGKTPNRKTIFMHRVVAKTPENMFCDHVHHDTLDNRRSELRNVTRSENGMNKKVHKNSKTGIAGVHKRYNGTYAAMLRIKGVFILNKTFKNIDDAIEARQSAEEEHFREFSINHSQL